MVQRKANGRIRALEDREGVKEPTKVYQRDILDKMHLHGGEENGNSEQLSFIAGCNKSNWL